MKVSKKIIAVILCVVMTFSVFTVAMTSSAKEKITPILFVPGIGQSQTYKYDDAGKEIADWNLFHITFDTASLDLSDWVNLVRLVAELCITIGTQKDVVQKERFAGLFEILFADHLKDENDNFINNVVCPNYDCSLKDYNKDAKNIFYSRIPCEDLVKTVGAENIYVYNYSVFSNCDKNAQGLHDYIVNVVLKQTGAEKVVLVPMSMGASVVNNYYNLYPEDNKVEKVVSIVGAWQGSDVFADLLMADFDKNDPELCYTEAINDIGLFADDEAYIGYLINIAVRILPKQEVDYLLYDILDALLETVIIKNTAFTALVPPDRYEEVAAKFYATEDMADLATQTARYADAQAHLKERLAYQQTKFGTEFYFISGYNMQFGDGEFGFFKFFESYDETNSDEVIQISSTAPGTSYVPAGTSFDADYIANPAHRCSPEGSIDASTCYYKDTTWYFEGQMHELTDNNTALKLAFDIALNKVKSINDCKDVYPQFNESRNVRRLTRDYLPDAKSIDPAGLEAADAQKLNAAIKAAEDMLNRTVNDRDADDAIIANLLSVLKEMNAKYNLFKDSYLPDAEPDQVLEVATGVLGVVDKVLLKLFGKDGYSQFWFQFTPAK